MLYIIRERICITPSPFFLRWNIISFYIFSKELFLIFLVIFFPYVLEQGSQTPGI